jgi:hypothetical protein
VLLPFMTSGRISRIRVPRLRCSAFALSTRLSLRRGQRPAIPNHAPRAIVLRSQPAGESIRKPIWTKTMAFWRLRFAIAARKKALADHHGIRNAA